MQKTDKMPKAIFGSIQELGKPYGGWFAGHFVEDESVFHTTDFEVKWAVIKAGETKEITAGRNDGVKTIDILVSGEYRVDFYDGDEFVMKNPGDYIFYPNLAPHKNTAVKDTTLLVLRWPSVAA